MLEPRILPLSEQALVVEFGPGWDPGLNDRAVGLHLRLLAQPFPGFMESVPAYSSLTVFFDAVKILSLAKQGPAMEYVTEQLRSRMTASFDAGGGNGETLTVPVCYDESVAPDLAWVCRHKGVGKDELIDIHTSTTYRVYMNGFVPGFPYLGILPETLEVPRKSSPSLRVPPGSVAIAGRQTGIYPFETPGGWQVIGRTPWKLFDKSNDPCCLLRPGMRVRFRAVALSELKDAQP